MGSTRTLVWPSALTQGGLKYPWQGVGLPIVVCAVCIGFISLTFAAVGGVLSLVAVICVCVFAFPVGLGGVC